MLKHQLDRVKAEFAAEHYVHIGDTNIDRHMPNVTDSRTSIRIGVESSICRISGFAENELVAVSGAPRRGCRRRRDIRAPFSTQCERARLAAMVAARLGELSPRT